MKNIVETNDITFSYGKEIIIRNISMRIPEGSIFGFVGPNGAGKSTTIKLLLGLLVPRHGTIELFGKDFRQHRTELLKLIGSLVETPSLYPHLTAEENLEIVRKIHRVPKAQIDHVLSGNGILYAKKKKVKEFSLGMKQRLGIALSLIHSPRLLILDEPTNGLDPEGIQEFRFFLKRLSDEEGVTILLSSHILAELEQVVSDVGIIARGELKFHGTLENLKQKQHGTLVLETSHNERAVSIIHGSSYDAELQSNGTIHIRAAGKESAARVNALLVNAGIDVYQLKFEQPNLESIFLELVQEGGRS